MAKLRSYTVHCPRRIAGDAAAEADQITFIKEGFCWPALFVPFLWLLYHRMWWILLAYIVAEFLVVGLSTLVDASAGVSAILGLALQFALATEANDLRRWTIGRRGTEFVGTAQGLSLHDAEMSYFGKWVNRVRERRQAESESEAEIAFRANPQPDVPPGAPA